MEQRRRRKKSKVFSRSKKKMTQSIMKVKSTFLLLKVHMSIQLH